MRCPSCGGVLGLDCFNPVECAQIGNNNSGQEIQMLEHQVAVLKRALIENGINIPQLEPGREESRNECLSDLPF